MDGKGGEIISASRYFNFLFLSYDATRRMAFKKNFKENVQFSLFVEKKASIKVYAKIFISYALIAFRDTFAI